MVISKIADTVLRDRRPKLVDRFMEIAYARDGSPHIEIGEQRH